MKQVAALCIALVLALVAGAAAAHEPPPRPQQPSGDIFSCGAQTCDFYNTLTQKVRATGEVRYRWRVANGCVEGNTHQTFTAALLDMQRTLSSNLRFIETNVNYDLTVSVNCGVEFAAVCGGPPVIGCLGRGFPSVQDVDVSDAMRAFFELSQTSIWCHEFCGHAVASWEEQYCKAAGVPRGCSARFAAVPGWQDIMNTGAESRHYLGPIEIERWIRTMAAESPWTDCCAWNELGWYFWTCGPNDPKGFQLRLWAYDRVTGGWRDLGLIQAPPANGCRGQHPPHLGPNEMPCVDWENAIDTAPYWVTDPHCAEAWITPY